ncbi:hypothetical protein BDP27DRAFT_1424649 [Rhodocollybia butyracea]|uniref:Uncharacterized protein n=1 Tax=Rhodocollybia butyracea TaxID=206335 RepID=A0A9P5PNE1_9AGAR|nr:hypothetical protein BDP27DRAFT_1424649 [Rhodocollybia butyracea]
MAPQLVQSTPQMDVVLSSKQHYHSSHSPAMARHWYTASQARIDKLMLQAYLAELAGLVLKKGWEGKMRREVMGAKMGTDVSFAEWAYETQNLSLSPELQQDLDAEPVLATELNAWIAEVKSRDDKVAIETDRIQTAVSAAHTRDAQKSKKSLVIASRHTKPRSQTVSLVLSPRLKLLNVLPSHREEDLLDIHDGCRRCRVFYIGHRTANCTDCRSSRKNCCVCLQVKREPVGVTIQKLALPADEKSSDTDGIAAFSPSKRGGQFIVIIGGAATLHGICEIENIIEGRKLDIAHRMPFLTAEHIVIDVQARTAIDKRVGYDLLNPPVHPPRPPPPVWVTPPPTPKKVHLPKREFIPTNSADLPVSVMLDVQQHIETLALQKLLQQENILMKEKHADMFPLRLPDTVDLPDDILHRIRLKDPSLITSGRQYRPARKNLESWKRMLDDHLKAGRMRASSSEFSSPAFVVPKHKGHEIDHSVDPRWVNDYPALNANTV